jgi:hypothetical protein
VGVVKRRVLRGLRRRLVGVGVLGPVSFETSALIMLLAALGRLLWRGLRFAPVLYGRVFLMYRAIRLVVLAYIRSTRRYGHLFFGGPGQSGRGFRAPALIIPLAALGRLL